MTEVEELIKSMKSLEETQENINNCFESGEEFNYGNVIELSMVELTDTKELAKLAQKCLNNCVKNGEINPEAMTELANALNVHTDEIENLLHNAM